MNPKFKKLFGAAALSLAAVVAAPSASAAIITGSWDPALPEAFGNFGWTATINIRAPENCGVGTQALTLVNLFGASFGCNGNTFPLNDAFRIISAEVGIYDLDTNRILEVLTFTSSFGAPLLARLDLNKDGDILYLATLRPSNPLLSALTYAGDCKYNFRLALPGADPAIQYRHQAGTRPVTEPGCAGVSNGFTTATNPIDLRRFSVSTTETNEQVIARTALKEGDLVFRVPEPGSLLLVLLALGAAGVAARRRLRDT